MNDVNLDALDLRAAHFAVSDYLRHRPAAPPSLHRLRDKLDHLIRCPVSPSRQETVAAQVEWIPTNAVAEILNWNLRRVQRHRADFGGEMIGGRLLFDATAVHEYAKGLHHGPIAARD